MNEDDPLVTQLSFSGGTGSGCIAEMLLRGDIERPRNLVVIRSNPGMENGETNKYCEFMAERFRASDIPYIEVHRNLFEEIMALKKSGATRFDLPPLWTRNRETGKKGRLLQKCTHAYKIAPMDRALREWMHFNRRVRISRRTKSITPRTVRKWIGFSSDEWMRIKIPIQGYYFLEYPLIDLKMSKADIAGYYLKHNLKLPPRSVCNACYANDVATFKVMHDERPDEFWGQAVAVDEEIRDLRCVGVTDECFVSSTLIPLRQLAEMSFILPPKIQEEADQSCHSGHCFV